MKRRLITRGGIRVHADWRVEGVSKYIQIHSIVEVFNILLHTAPSPQRTTNKSENNTVEVNLILTIVVIIIKIKYQNDHK